MTVLTPIVFFILLSHTLAAPPTLQDLVRSGTFIQKDQEIVGTRLGTFTFPFPNGTFFQGFTLAASLSLLPGGSPLVSINNNNNYNNNPNSTDNNNNNNGANSNFNNNNNNNALANANVNNNPLPGIIEQTNTFNNAPSKDSNLGNNADNLNSVQVNANPSFDDEDEDKRKYAGLAALVAEMVPNFAEIMKDQSQVIFWKMPKAPFFEDLS